MSDFLSDLSNWALRGGAGRAQNNNGDGESGNASDEAGQENPSDNAAAPDTGPSLTPEEMRAQRLARMELLEKQKKEAAAAAPPEPMDIDEKPAPKKSPPKKTPSPQPPPPIAKKMEQKKKKPKNEAKPSSASSTDPTRKLQRKKEAMLAKTLKIALSGTPTTSSTANVVIDIDSTNISVQTIAEILATRLSLPPDDESLQNVSPSPKPLIAYLATSYREANEELRSSKVPELIEILEEIKSQVVSYAATTLMEPELFEQGADGVQQLEQALLYGVTDLSASLTLGNSQSFYHKLCDELGQQNEAALVETVRTIVTSLAKKLERCDSVLDGVDGSSPVVIVSSMAALCSHKRAGMAVATMDGFLLPAEGSREALEIVRPPMPTNGTNLLQLLAGGGNQPYLKRSGPGLEKRTLLGKALGLGAPKSNGAFTPGAVLRQAPSVVDSIHSSQRSNLTAHQNACNQLIWNLVKAGAASRSAVMQWFGDAIQVNKTADAMQVDSRKVSSPSLLLNMSVVLLKLCNPFVNDDKKQGLIDPGYVRWAEKLFPKTGDDAVSRLGESNSGGDAMDTDYKPENAFVPECFFLCARSLHFGIVPQLSKYESLLRHVSHLHWRITSQNGDLQSDPRFSSLIAQQRSMEVALFQEEMVKDILQFSNFTAKVLYDLSDEALSTMPQDFVSDLCDIIMGIAKLKARLLRNAEVRHIFKLMVKLLSAKYASVSSDVVVTR